MARRENIRKGTFVVAGGGHASIGKPERAYRKGQFLTVDAVVDRPKPLEKQFPEMADALAHAGPPLTTQQLAEHWRRQYELEERLEDLKTRIKAAKRG